MSKWRIFIVCLILLTLPVMLVPGCDTDKYTLTIEVNPSDGGTTSPVVGTYDYDDKTEIAITATAADGYVFDHWSGDASGNTTSINITMTSDKSITANFAPTYNLTVNVEPAGAGEITRSDDGPYKEDTEVALTATPANGYVFDHWSGDASGDSNQVAMTMNSNKTITAHFASTDMYTLTVNVNPSYGGTVEISPSLDFYEPGTAVTLTAKPHTGNSFDYWSGDLLGSEESVTIIINSDMNVTARFDCG